MVKEADANQRYQIEQDRQRLARERELRVHSMINILNSVLISNPVASEDWERTKEFCSIYAGVDNVFPAVRKFWELVRDDPDARVLLSQLVDLGREGIRYRKLAESVNGNRELMDFFRRAEEG